jgi:hypothetical protein
MADFNKMEYRDSSTDNSKITSIYQNATTEENALPANYFDSNSRNCKESSPVDFLYLSTIRGGRNMLTKTTKRKRKGGNCGCNMTGGDDDLGNIGTVNEMGQQIGQQFDQSYDQQPGQSYDDQQIDQSYQEQTGQQNDQPYQEQTGQQNDQSYQEQTDQSYDQQTGGCFTCKKGIKNITHIYSTVHIIIPTLYSKYKKGISMKVTKIKKPKPKGVKK